MLGYTLQRLLTQKAIVERDNGVGDAYGADSPPDWQPHLTVACRLWFAKAGGERSPNRTYVDAARAAPVSEGGLLLPLGTDVTEKDRITRILDEHGNVYVDGNFTITAVVPGEDHLEVELERAHLGA